MSVHISKLNHSFGEHRVLSGINLDIRPGEQVALIGPSGSGKTTLLRILGTQLVPGSGSVRVMDLNPAQLGVRDLRQLRHQIAMIPQHLGLVPNVRVIRNILNGGLGRLSLTQTLRQILWQTKREQRAAHKLLERTGIGEKLFDRTDSLSGGQQQRVAVARALYQNPAIILADEPISAVDPTRARDMIALLTELSRQEGLTLIVSLHNFKLACEYFPRLIGLREGEVAFDAVPQELTQEDRLALYQLDHAD